MKRVLLTLTLIGACSSAFAERETQGVLIVRAANQSALDQLIRQTAANIQAGRGQGLHDQCGSSRRRVYAVESSCGHYRGDRHGNLTGYCSAAIKYSCH